MKTLYVVRHAKSSWKESGLSDFDRPLNDRGRKDALRMGKRLKQKQVKPDLMVTSPAKRALSTCKRIAEILDYPKEKIKTDQQMYHADEEELLSVVRNVNDRHGSLMVYGHNPGLTNFVHALSHDHKMEVDDIPTCGIVAFSFEVKSWKNIEFGNGTFLFFDYPKNKDD